VTDLGNAKVMDLKANDKITWTLFRRGLLACVFIGGVCAALPTFAQPETAQPSTQNINQNAAPSASAAPAPAETEETTRQLSADAVQQQIPPAFPDATGGTSVPAQAPAAQPGSDSAASSQSTNQPVALDQAGGNSSPGQIPAQPEQKKLVPATPMGAAAQNAASGASAASNQEAQPQTPETGNPVEDAAANYDAAANTAEAAAEGAPTADILEQYTAKANEAAGEREAAAPEENLPEVNNLNMVTLEGSGFENANKRVTVGVDSGLMDGKTSAELQEEIKTEAFDAAITGMFPLTPEQIDGLLKRYDKTQRASQTPPYDAPKPEVNVINVSLDPGVMPPSIKTAVGNVTTLNILDATGAPWPVQDVTWAGDYEVVEPEEGSHIIRITPLSHFARGNIVIRMLTLKTPLTFSLETGRDVVQYRVDARIPEYGPFATAPIMQGGKSLVAGSPDLMSLLDGVMPNGMMRLKVSGVDGRTTAYMMGGTTYVRTPLTLLSPPWQSSVSSADGMNVYALSSAPVLLLSDSGEFVRATISEKEDLLDE
jgi:intracellular multiplication protein IcmK